MIFDQSSNLYNQQAARLSMPMKAGVCALTLAIFVAGCGDRKIKTGVFVDSAVDNLGYRSHSVEGFTGIGGEYNYRRNESIEFFIGGLSLGSSPTESFLTPINLELNGSIDSPSVINKAILLQSLDVDSNTDNGISIPALAHTTAPSSLNFEQTTASFIASTQVLDFVRTAKNQPAAALVSAADARAHLLASINARAPVASPSTETSTISASASAGTVVQGQEVILTGLPGATIQATRWEQSTQNPFDVALTFGAANNANGLTQYQASFIAPAVTEDGIFSFFFIGTDAANQEYRAQIDVRVNAGGASSVNSQLNGSVNGQTNGFNTPRLSTASPPAF